jgi:hypothetical protein
VNTFACVHREDALCVLESFCSETNWSCIGTHLQMNNKINKILLIYWYDERNLNSSTLKNVCLSISLILFFNKKKRVHFPIYYNSKCSLKGNV